MKRTAEIGLGLVLLGGLVAGGCGGPIHITFVNHTDKEVELELDGPHPGDDDIGVLPPGGKFRYDLVVPEEKLPATFELEAGKHETEFTVNKYTPRRLRVDVYRDHMRGPR